ncbi:MAG: CpaF family protein [Pirellulaceae bacterium]|nr:CpaF family protein [Pirellulaceae bacterium]
MAWLRGTNGKQHPAVAGQTVVLDAPVEPVPIPTEPVTSPVVESDPPPEEQAADWFLTLKRELHQQIVGKLNPGVLRSMKEDELKEEVRRQTEALCQERAELLNATERERLVVEVLDETFGLGPLEQLLRDPDISDILINGPRSIYIEKRGRLTKSPVVFSDERHLVQVVQRIVGKVGRRIDETNPLCDARLMDGSRFNAVLSPIALDGASVSIRRFGNKPLMAETLIANKSITKEMLQFLSACVQARVNIIISGGTGSGKTTLLNALSRYIPADERVVTIEDAAELRLQQPHVVRLETRPANIEGHGEITTRDLVKNALRMRPERIIVGECRSGEALDMLQAMNTGHDGSMTTIHANTPRDAVSRLEMMVGMAGFELPIWVIRKQVSSTINVIVQAARLIGGPRKITRITEITGMEGDVVSMQDIFEFKQTGLDENRVAQGHFVCHGIRPVILEKLQACGIPVPVEIFERRVMQV